jgi:taurine dioxygenase
VLRPACNLPADKALLQSQRRAEEREPLVRTRAEIKRPALYLSPNRMEKILGLEREESDILLDELSRHDAG